MTAYYRVSLSGTLVGHLAKDSRDHFYFQFDEDYVGMADRPVLGQRFEDDLTRRYRGKRQNLPSFFANLVPEGPFRELVEKSLRIEPGNDLALLAAAGEDLPGAVTIVQTDHVPEFEEDESHSNGTYDDESGTPDTAMEPKLRFSLAGVQLKFSVLTERDRVTLPVSHQYGDWIAKLDSLRFPRLAENEYATLRWARGAGFDVPETKLLPSTSLPEALRRTAPEDSQVFLIQRYDRTEGGKVHQEDFAQVVGLMPSKKYDQVTYEQLGSLVSGIVGDSGLVDYLRRLAFMVASANVDAHLKNWSLVYPDGINPQLAPLYDQVCIVAWDESVDMEWALKFASSRNVYETDMQSFIRVGRRAGVADDEVVAIVSETIEAVAEAWGSSGAVDVMPAGHVAKLQAHWNRSPLLRQHSAAISGTS